MDKPNIDNYPTKTDSDSDKLIAVSQFAMDLTRYIAHLESEQQERWVSVEDRLPETTEDYLCVTPTGVQVIYYYVDMQRFALSTTTHWMPLPNPPISDTSNDKE